MYVVVGVRDIRKHHTNSSSFPDHVGQSSSVYEHVIPSWGRGGGGHLSIYSGTRWKDLYEKIKIYTNEVIYYYVLYKHHRDFTEGNVST